MSNTLGRIEYEWTGEVMRPLQRFLSSMQEKLIVGGVYTLEPSSRSTRSHNHQFAEVTDAWRNLPDTLRDRFPSPEHLRKWALCQTPYCNVDQHVESSRKSAEHLVRLILRLEEFAQTAIVPLDENDSDGACAVVTKLAWSQSKPAMGGTVFQQSKDAVLDVIAGLLGTTPEALKRATKEAA